MPISGDIKFKEASQKTWDIVPADIYQVVVRDIEEKDFPDYKDPDKMVGKYIMKYTILDDNKFTNPAGEEVSTQGMQVVDFMTPSLFGGAEGLSQSKLVGMLKEIKAFYKDEFDFDAGEANELPQDEKVAIVNNLIGKQVRATVKVVNEKNRISDYASIKKEMDIPEGIELGTGKESSLDEFEKSLIAGEPLD